MNQAQKLIAESIRTKTTVKAEYSAELDAQLAREVDRERGRIIRKPSASYFEGASGWSTGTAKFGWSVELPTE